MAAQDVNTTIVNVKAMLAALTAWQTITGTASAAEATKRIYEYGVEETEYSLCPCIVVDIDEQRSSWTAGALRGNLTVNVTIELEIPEFNRNTFSTQAVWYWTQLSSLIAGINGAVNNSGGLMFEEVTMPLKPGRIDPSENQGRVEWMSIIGLVITLQ